MKNIFIGLVVFMVLIFGIAYILYNDSRTEETNTPTEDQTNSNENEEEEEDVSDNLNIDLPEGYRLHAEPDLGYALGIPLSVDISSPQTGITRYRFLGPENEPNTEITDGYTITIEAKRSSTPSLDALISKETGNKNDQNNIFEEPTTARIAGQETRRYVTESELGNKLITHYAFLPGNGFEYIVSVNISPESNADYQATTTQILNTLRFFEEDVARSLRPRIIPIAMLDYESGGGLFIRESDGKSRGCDKVVIIDHVLENQTATPLNASLEQLFAYEEDTVGGWQNFIASRKDTLSFDRAEIIDRTAHIYLTGQLGPLGGVCDNPRTAIQIEETALAYDTVDDVQLYLNGGKTSLSPDGR